MKKTLLALALILALAAPAASGQLELPEPPPAKLTDREILLEAQLKSIQIRAAQARLSALAAEYKRRHPEEVKKAEPAKPATPAQEGGN